MVTWTTYPEIDNAYEAKIDTWTIFVRQGRFARIVLSESGDDMPRAYKLAATAEEAMKREALDRLRDVLRGRLATAQHALAVLNDLDPA